MLYTSSYNDCKTNKIRTVSISGDRGKKVGFTGECCPVLAPKKSFWEQWHSNIGIKSESENILFYIQRYYEEVLLHLNAIDIYEQYQDTIFLCYEDSFSFCHRQIVAAWLELELNVAIPEVSVIDDEIITKERDPRIKQFLKTVMFVYDKEHIFGLSLTK